MKIHNARSLFLTGLVCTAAAAAPAAAEPTAAAPAAEPTAAALDASAVSIGSPVTRDAASGRLSSSAAEGAPEAAVPRVALGVNSPAGWLIKSYGASVSVGVNRHHAVRANIALNRTELLASMFRPGPLQTGSIQDVSLGWVYFPKRLWDGLMLEAGVLRRDRDVEDFIFISFGDETPGKTRSVMHAGRAMIGWSWPVTRHGYISAAVGVSVGREVSKDRITDTMGTRPLFDRVEVAPELSLRFGLTFGR